jgi:hypothetical protein
LSALVSALHPGGDFKIKGLKPLPLPGSKLRCRPLFMNPIGRDFGLKPHAVKDLQKMLRDENHETTLALKAIGVSYGSEGKGRGARRFLVNVKAA